MGTWWLLPLVVGLAARWAWLGLVDTQPVTDFEWYFQRAASVARGEGYTVDGVPTAYWPVGWPGFLGIVFAVFGTSLAAAKSANLVLGTAVCGLVPVFAAQRGASRAQAVAAGLLCALYPAWWAYAGVLASEPLTVVLCLSALVLARPGRRAGWWFGGGLAAGLAALARPQALLIVAAALAADAWWGARPGRARAGWLCAGAALAVAPWTARNAVVLGAFVPVSTNGGDNLLIGHAPGADGGYRRPLEIEPRLAGLSEVQRDRSSARLALGHVRRDPLRSASLVPAKLYETFLKHTDAPYWAFQTERGRLSDPGAGPHREGFVAYRDWCRWAGNGLLALAAAGALAAWWRRGPGTWAQASACAVGAVASLAALFFGNGRFGLPAVPFLAVLAAGLIPARRSS